jgi:DNA-binding MarR family transcriptional regulator
MTVKELGDRLYLDSGTLTPLLKRMETAGLVTRTRSQSDERKVYIQLTAKGEKLKEEAYAVPETLLQKTGLSGKEFVNMLAVFQDFLKQVHEINQTNK